MSENRKPNTKCFRCQKGMYRRPWEIEKCNRNYCSKKCLSADNLLPKLSCKQCSEIFQPKTRRQMFCSKSCVGKSTRNRLGTKSGVRKDKNTTIKRLRILKEKFNFVSCMVEGCDYSNTFDIHRLSPGCKGGKYEIGNMFAICPNHHAEYHRNIIDLKKINDGKLKTITKNI